MLLEGKVAIVTGAATRRGIGRATVRAMAREGASILVADKNQEGAEVGVAEVRALGGAAQAIQVDVTREEDTRRMAEEAIDAFGQIDILANCAGITRATPVHQISVEEWDLILNVDLKGVFLCTRAVLPHMMEQRYGRIVSISSVSGKQGGGVFGSAHYCVAKAGVAGFTKAVAKQMGAYGITANSVAPGLIDTDITVGLADEETRTRSFAKSLEGIVLGRLGTAEDVAELITFLASDRASYITGEDVDINGGLHID
ncbi:MAG TPA: 3-oxoacyl-ACP reductase family protein, partial [Chloroflexota bacterium]|nr:3-oxoacyl-ACP reductase family protein [Chloroflexota bacterium]